MLKPSISDLMKLHNNRYALVIAVAKRARQIASKAEAENEVLEEKPVNTAINEFINKKYRIV